MAEEHDRELDLHRQGAALREQIVARFKAAHHRQESPAIDDYLAEAADQRASLLIELVHADLECGLQAGQPVRVEQYLNRYPELAGNTDATIELIRAEHNLRRRAEPAIEIDEFYQRFPQYRTELVNRLGQPVSPGENQTISGIFLKTSTLRPPEPTGRRLPGLRTALHIRCPHCHGPIEIVDDQPLVEMTCPSCGSNFTVATSDTVDSPTRSTVTQRRLKKVGHFELLEQVGTGGFGTVWKARDTKLDRLVAVKIPRRGNLGPDEVEQFVREARAAAQLQHPNVVSVHEVGLENDVIYIVSDFIEGRTLDRWLADQIPTHRETTELCQKLAGALHYAHTQGVIHRDLKPGNVMIDAQDQPHVMDFGLAKREAGEITMTVEGQILGTPAYMSPEQAKGEGYAADRRTDVYSLGVILFEMLSGERPFRGNVRMMLKQVIEDDPPSPRKLDSRIPRDLETICLKCLRKEPDKRYASAAELADELGRFLKGEPVLARPVSRLERGWRWCQRNPALATTAAAAVVFLVGGAATASWFAVAANYQAGEAQAQRMAAEQSAKLANTRASEARDQFANAAVIVARTALQVDDVQRARDWLEKVPTQPEMLRRWDWHFLQRQLNGGLFTLYGHTNGVLSCAWSPDGSRLATGGGDRVVRLWEARTGRPVGTLDGHEEEVTSVDFSRDGRFLVSAGDRSPRLWDMKSLQIMRKLPEHPADVHCARFSPDNTLLATACNDDTITIWDVATGNQLFRRLGQRRNNRLVTMPTVSFSPDGSRLATISTDFFSLRVLEVSSGRELLKDSTSSWTIAYSPDGTQLVTTDYGVLNVKDASTGKSLLKLDGHAKVNGTVICAAFSPDGTQIASASVDNTVRTWDARTGKQLRVLRGHTSGVNHLAFSPDGGFLLTASHDRTARVWNALAAEPCVEIPTERAEDIVLSPDGQRAIVDAKSGKELEVWDLRTAEQIRTIGRHTDSVLHFSTRKDGKWVATASSDQTACLWDVETGQQLLRIVPHGCSLTAMAVSADDKRTAVGTSRGQIGLALNNRNWNVTIEAHQGDVLALAFSPDGKRLLSGGRDKQAVVWDVQTGKRLLDLTGHAARVNAVAYHPLGTHIATGSEDGSVRLFDSTSGKLVLDLKARDGAVLCLEFSPGGGSLAAGSDSGWVTIWETKQGTQQQARKAHDVEVRALAYSPSGDRLATACADGIAHVWDQNTERLLLSLTGHQGGLTRIRFSRDGFALATAGRDGTVRGWSAITGEPSDNFDLYFRANGNPVIGFALDARGQIFALSREDGKVSFREGTSGTTISFGNGTVRHVAVSPDGKYLATACAAGVQLWETQSSRLVLALNSSEPNLHPVFSPDGAILATIWNNKSIRLWEVATGRAVRTIEAHEANVGCLSFSRDGSRLLTGGYDRRARLWEVRSGKMLTEIIGHTYTVWCAALSPDGTRIGTGSGDPVALVSDARTGTPVAELGGHTRWVQGAAFTPDGKQFITSDGQRLRIWSARNAPSLDLKGHTGEVWGSAFSPDGARVVTGSDDHTARVWNARTGENLHVLHGHTGGVTPVMFSPDGKWIATGSNDFTARVWNAETGELKHTFGGHTFAVWAVAFTPDSQRLTSWGGGTFTWDLQTGERLPNAEPATFVDRTASPDGRWVSVRLGTACRLVEVVLDDEELAWRRLLTRVDMGRHQRVVLDHTFHPEDVPAFAAVFSLERLLMQQPPDRTRLIEKRREIVAKVAKSDPNSYFARRILARDSVLRAQDSDRNTYLAELRAAEKGKDPLALRVLGGLLLREGQRAEALPLLQSALTLRHAEAPPVEELILALLAHEAGQPDDARAWLSQARQQLPPEFPVVPVPSSSRPSDWESWHETEVLLKEVESRLAR